MQTRILLVDESPVRQPFLSELLRNSGKVTGIPDTQEAVKAIGDGLPVDVAVLHYRTKSGHLVRALRNFCPKSKIVAYGSPRRMTPSGVDQYLHKPLLGVEVLQVVESMRGKQSNGHHANGHHANGRTKVRAHA